MSFFLLWKLSYAVNIISKAVLCTLCINNDADSDDGGSVYEALTVLKLGFNSFGSFHTHQSPVVRVLQWSSFYRVVHWNLGFLDGTNGKELTC